MPVQLNTRYLRAQLYFSAQRLNPIGQLLEHGARPMPVVDPSLVIGLGDLSADAKQLLHQIDETESLDLFRSKLLGYVIRIRLPHLARVVAEAHAV